MSLWFDIMPFYGHDVSLVERENLGAGDGYGSINYGALVGISASLGNAGTAALSTQAVVFCDLEEGFDAVGGGSSYPGGVIGTHVGGLTVAW